MSKYKVGDKVLLQGEIMDIDNDLGDYFYWVKLADDTCDWVSEKNMLNNHKTYEDGLNDAWELARKIVLVQGDGGYAMSEIRNIFGTSNECKILRELSVQQALAKIEAYEESKAIKVGDVIYADDEPDSFGVVTWKQGNGVYVMWDDGSCGDETNIDELHKTGRHIDIEHLLEQIRGNY